MIVQHTFTGNPLDRAAAARRDSDWVGARLEDRTTRFLLLRDLRPLLREDDGGLRIAWKNREIVGYPVVGQIDFEAVLLGVDRSGSAHFAVEIGPDSPDRPVVDAAVGESFTDTRAAAASLPVPESAIVAQARSLLSWHRDHPICSRCGGATSAVEAGYARRCMREECAASHFPRTDPVVISMVVNRDAALLGRSVRRPPFPPGLYSCLAGYVEPGESVEEAVRREILEEAGIEIGQVRYHSSQPWPFPSSLMIGCFAEAMSSAVRLDPAEIEDARWFDRAEVSIALARWAESSGVRLPPPLTAAHRLVKAWLDGEPGTSFEPGGAG